MNSLAASHSATSVLDRGVLNVRLNMDHAPRNLALLAPGGVPCWGKCRFEINPPPGGDADFCIVLANANAEDRFRVGLTNTLFIAAEPQDKKVYPKAYYEQFHHVVDTHAGSRHPRIEQTALGMCWHVGLDMHDYAYRYGYDKLSTLPRPEKVNKLSVVCSDAAFTPGQRLRLQFLDGLKRRLGDRLVHYGRGFRPISDKMEAIEPYRFHLALENCEVPHYWTEKLADAYLGWAFPFYVGCTNLDSYFSDESFIRLDPNDVAGAADRITRLLDAPVTVVEVAAVEQARRRVLDVYNPFAWCAQWAERWHQPLEKQAVILRSAKAFRPFPQGFLYRLRAARKASRKATPGDATGKD